MPGPHLGMRNKQEVFVFGKRRHFLKFLEFCIGATTAPTGLCWHHKADSAMMAALHADGGDDVQVLNALLHRLMHSLVDAYRLRRYNLPAWFQIGIGHWAERRESQKHNTYCFSEGTKPSVPRTWRYLPAVKKRVAKGDVPPFVSFSDHVYGAFRPEDHMVCYSLVCYLLSLGPEKLRVFLDVLKGKEDTEPIGRAQVRAFREACGLSPLRFDEGWRRWVLAVYPDA